MSKTIGIGTDLIEVARIRKSYERFGVDFLNKVFTEQEQAYCLTKKDPTLSLSARFAAKEAVSKALGTGIGERLMWTSVEVAKGSNDEPLIHLDALGAATLKSKGGTSILISLTHTQEYAQAFAIVLG